MRLHIVSHTELSNAIVLEKVEVDSGEDSLFRTRELMMLLSWLVRFD